MSKTVGERLKAIGFVAILLVLLVHLWRMPSTWYVTSGMQGMTFWQVVVNLGVTQAMGWLAVPTFFGISGFWLVKDYDGSFRWWWRSVSKRIKTVLIPMIVWVLIALVYETMCGALRVPDSHNWYLPTETQQFWYFRTLFIYVILSPLLLWILKFYMPGFAVVCVLWLSAFIALPGQSEYFMWVNHSAFAGGMWMGLHFEEVAKRFGPVYRKLKPMIWVAYVLLAIVLVVLGFLHMRILTNRVRFLLVPLGCASLWMLSPWFVRVLKPVKAVYSLNIFIFAIHFVVMWRIGSLLSGCGMNSQSVGFMAIQFVAEVLVCVGLGLLMRRFFPRTLAFLSGGRT